MNSTKKKRLFIQIYNVEFNDSLLLYWGFKINKHNFFDIQYFGNNVRILKSKKTTRNSIPLILFQDSVKNAFSKYSKKKIKIYVSDIDGKTFCAPIGLKVGELIEMTSKDFKSTISESEYEDYCYEFTNIESLQNYLHEQGFENGRQ